MLIRKFSALLLLLIVTTTAVHAQVAPASVQLRCVGTEPFWSVFVSRGRMTYSTPGQRDATLRVRSVNTAAGMSPETVRVIRSQHARLTVVAGACSDGMSDLEYGYHAVYEHSDTVLYGCCRVLP